MTRLWRALGLASLLLSAVATPGPAQQQGLVVSDPYNFRDTYAANPLGFGPKDILRVGLRVNHSDRPASVVAVQGANVITIPVLPTAIEDDKHEIEMPFDPALVGPWTITVTRDGQSVAVQSPGVAEPVLVPFVTDLAVDLSNGLPELTWVWPDLTDVLAPGATMLVEIGVTEEDTRDEFILAWGLSDRGPIEVGAAGAQYRLGIPIGELDANRLYLFRVVLTLVGPDGDFIARTWTYDDRLFPLPDPGQLAPP
jgi:hypothetical protein